MGEWKLAGVTRSLSKSRQFGMAALVTMGVVTGCVGATGNHARGDVKASTVSSACQPKSAIPPGNVTDFYDRRVLSYAPVMYLTMAHHAKGSETDLSGHGHTGTYLPAGQLPGGTALPNGDQVTLFNGRGQYLEVPSASSLSVPATGCLTVQAWVRPDVLQFPEEEGSGYVYILGKGASSQQEYALRMYSQTNKENPERPNRVSAYVFNPRGGMGSGAYFQDKVQAHAWMMVTFVIDDQPSPAWPDGYVAIYKGAQLRGQVSISQFNVTPQAGDAPFRVATRQGNSFFKGAIGKVAVFDYALSAQQVGSIYNAMPHLAGTGSSRAASRSAR